MSSRVVQLITFVFLVNITVSQHLLSCPDNDCWCCPFKAGKCYNEAEKPACCCETQNSYPCYEASGCCEYGTTCCYEGCCEAGTTCCGSDACCYDQPYYFHGTCRVSKRKIKRGGLRRPNRNLTESTCDSTSCFCCCEELVCPIKQTGSTQSCIERSEGIDMYCDEMSPCQQESMKKTGKNKLDFNLAASKYPKDNLTSEARLNHINQLDDIIDVTNITQIRRIFYQHQGKSKNFQFAVFKFRPSYSDWDPPINLDLHWSKPLVVDSVANTWQASSYASCQDGCHTEATIINKIGTSGFHQMLSHECKQLAPYWLNIYSFNSPCISGRPTGCETLIQNTLSNFFGDVQNEPCNRAGWKINIVWTIQFRDQTAVKCQESWRVWAVDLMEEFSNVTVRYGRQSVGKIPGKIKNYA